MVSRTALTLIGVACLLAPLPFSLAQGKAVPENSPDADVRQLQFSDLEAKLRTMPPGSEHDHFAGVLANAEDHIIESIQLLSRVLPSLRTSRPDRAAIALQALEDVSALSTSSMRMNEFPCLLIDPNRRRLLELRSLGIRPR